MTRTTKQSGWVCRDCGERKQTPQPRSRQCGDCFLQAWPCDCESVCECRDGGRPLDAELAVELFSSDGE